MDKDARCCYSNLQCSDSYNFEAVTGEGGTPKKQKICDACALADGCFLDGVRAQAFYLSVLVVCAGGVDSCHDFNVSRRDGSGYLKNGSPQ